MDNLQLIYGMDYIICDNLKIKNPKLSDVISLGIDKYNSYVNALTIEPIQIADILWNKCNIWYDEVTDWQLFISDFSNECKKGAESTLIHDALKYFIGLDFCLGYDSNKELILYCKDNGAKINKFNFKLISQFLRKINFIKEDELSYQLRHSGSKGTAKYILKQISKQRKLKKQNTDLQSIVSSLLWKSGVGKEIFDYSIFSIYEGYYRLNSIDNWDKTVTAYYAGTIDTSKGGINLDKINWTQTLIK